MRRGRSRGENDATPDWVAPTSGQQFNTAAVCLLWLCIDRCWSCDDALTAYGMKPSNAKKHINLATGEAV